MIKFVKVGKGQLALYHRPRDEDFSALHEQGCTHVITLLKESEGAQRYGNLTREAGMEWIWLSIPNGKYPEGEIHERLTQEMPKLSQLLDSGKSILIHCSAGIHRTGMVAYGLLRWRGLDRNRALKIIRQTRLETAKGMMEKRMRWGDENARSPHRQDTTCLRFVKEFANQLKMKLSRLR
jgi:protein-tyrosine phosphatase